VTIEHRILRKDLNTQNYNFACGFVWVWILIPDLEGKGKYLDPRELN
jgi:hypothetical protein